MPLEEDGGAVVTLVDDLPDGPFAIALDATRVYWADEVAVRSAALDGSDVSTLAHVGGTSLAVDAHAAYVTTTPSSASGASLQKVPIAGGLPVVIASGLISPAGVAIHGGNVYWVEGTDPSKSSTDPGSAVKTTCK